MEISDGEDEALKVFDLIIYQEEFSDNYAISCIDYLSEIESKKAISDIGSILDSDNDKIVIAAMKLIGKNRVKSQEKTLLSYLEDDDTEESVYVQVIKTLGSIKSKEAIKLLIPIADDEDEETTIRNAVCYSLGEIGDEEGIPVLKRCLGNRTNYLLRLSALEALGKFSSPDMDDILIQSLRDPHWSIREKAIEALGDKKVTKAFDILKYKALKDPETKIQKKAFYAIGDINSEECRDFLKEVYTEKSYSDTQKILAIEKLIEHNVDWIYPSIEERYNKDRLEKRKPILDATIKFFVNKEYKFGVDLYNKLLADDNYIYRLYAIQGIRLNKLSEFKEKLVTLSTTDKNKNIKKHALSAIEEL